MNRLNRPRPSSAARRSDTGTVVTGCLAGIVLAGVCAVAAHRLIGAHGEPAVRLGLAAAAGIFLGLGLQSFWSLARGFGQGEQSRASVLRRAKTGERPQEDAPILVSGTVRALGVPLIAPLSGVECAGYFYRMWYTTLDSKRRIQQVPIYWGHAWRPFAIDGAAMRYTILAVPHLDASPIPFSTAEARDRAKAFVAATTFEGGGMLNDVASAFAMAREMFNDADGETRRDWKRDDTHDPGTLFLEETVLPIGATASAYGIWSVQRSAIVAGTSAGGAASGQTSAVKVRLGPLERTPDASGSVNLDPSVAADLNADLPHSVFAYVVGAVILTAIGGGIIWGAINYLPPTP
jgi:hypothetical protein